MTAPGLQAIAQLLRVQERKARLMGVEAPTPRAVDVITHDAFMEAIADLEADVARTEAEREGARSGDSPGCQLHGERGCWCHSGRPLRARLRWDDMGSVGGRIHLDVRYRYVKAFAGMCHHVALKPV